MTQRPYSESLVTGAVLAFAWWTLCSQVVVAAGGNLYNLLVVFSLSSLAVLSILWRLQHPKEASSQEDIRQQAAARETADSSSGTPHILRYSCAAAALIGTPMIYRTGNLTALWWWIAGWLLVSFAASFWQEKSSPESANLRGQWREVVLWFLAIAALVFTLVAHRSDYDDSIYINFAVAAADYPGEALLAKDTLHGIEGLPLSLAIYRLQSWELLLGAISWLTGMEAIYVFHLLAAALAALFLPLANARLFRLLVPQHWPWAVGIFMVVLVAAGETHRWYGNFAFVRIWQGKSLLVSIFLPLVAAFALEYMARPTARRWFLLCAVQVAAVGVNVTALWAAPAVALSALVCAMRPTWQSLRVSVLGALTSSYILAAGAFSKKGVSKFVVPEEAVFDFGERGDLLLGALVEVLGQGRLLLFGLVVILLAWTLTPPGLGRRLATGLPLAVWVVLLNPYTAPLVFKQVTGPAYWRLLWSLPLPLLMALVLVSPLQLRGRRGPALCLALLMAYALFIPTISGFSPENRVLLRQNPTLKVRWPMYRLAQQINRRVPSGSHILAPDAVSMWIPTLHHHAYPLKARHYLNLNRFFLGEDDFEHRGAAMRYVAGEGETGDEELFRTGLERFHVEAVCLKLSKDAGKARFILTEAGFYGEFVKQDYEFWIRDRSMLYRDGFETGDVSSWSASRWTGN